MYIFKKKSKTNVTDTDFQNSLEKNKKSSNIQKGECCIEILVLGLIGGAGVLVADLLWN